MCGINLSFGEDNVKRMNDIIHHRGVRSNVTPLFDGLSLGHVRLPIQGISEKHDHPYKFGNITGAFVGEVFNFRELVPEAESDLPVLVQGFAVFGPRVFRFFDGFWAAILADDRDKTVHVFTDHLSKKPLYIRQTPFGISSEIKPLAALGPITFDPVYFSSVFKWGYSPEHRTPFKEIAKVPAGVHMVLQATEGESVRFNVHPCLSLNPKKLNVPEELITSVKNRIVSDEPVSLLMSGGLDSTILYYLLREITPELTIFHVDNGESEYLNDVKFRSGDKVVPINIEDTLWSIKDVLYANDGPVDLGSMVPQYLLASKVSDWGFRVCITGDGADELFGGYKRYSEYDAQMSDIFHELVFYHLPRLDKMSMAHTVELRCPFLAPNVIEGAMGMPYEKRIKKNGLKDMFRDIVPKSILERKKKPLRHFGGYSTEERVKLFKEIYEGGMNER